MPVQRARKAESRGRNRSSNGQLTVHRKAKRCRAECNVQAYVSCRGYAGILLKCMGQPMNARWLRYKKYIWLRDLTRKKTEIGDS